MATVCSERAAVRSSASDGRRPAPPAKQAVVIYTHSLLSSSMTFSGSHAEVLTRYLAVYAGSRRIEGLQLPNGEGLPTVILEVQAMSTSRHAGNPEGLVEGKSAVLLDERGVEGLAQVIRFFANNPAAFEECGRFGRQFVESNFGVEKQVVGLDRIYDEACGVQ